MRWLGQLLVVFTIFTVAGCTASAMSQDDVERENLTDIREVNVIVEELAADAEGAGLTHDVLETAIEQRLQQRGVPLGNSRLAADLYVNISTFSGANWSLRVLCGGVRAAACDDRGQPTPHPG